MKKRFADMADKRSEENLEHWELNLTIEKILKVLKEKGIT